MDREDRENIELGNIACSEEELNEEVNSDAISFAEKNIGTSDRPIDGPSYIMPSGRFLTIWKSNIPVSKYSASGSATHRDVQQYLYDNGYAKEDFWQVEDPDLERLGCIRVNGGFEEYIWLPDNNPNNAQWNSLLMWLDWYFRFHHKLTVGFKHYAPKTYYDSDYTTDEILKKCKEAYGRGYLTEDYTPTEDDFPFTIDDIVKYHPEIISDHYESCGPAFIMPDGRFILCGKNREMWETHSDYVSDLMFELVDGFELEDWNYDSSNLLRAFTEYFNLVRVNDGSTPAEDRAYFVILKSMMSSGQYRSLQDFIDYIIKNKYSKKIYDIQAFVRNAHHKWDLQFNNPTSDEIMDDVRFAMTRGFFGESLDEDVQDNVLDALDKEFGQEELYMWSTYILPNGHFLNPDNGNLKDPQYEHCDFEDWAHDKGYNVNDIYNNCIKMNVTYPYLSMPDKAKPTQEQFNAIRKILARKDLFEPEGSFYWYDIFPEEKVDSKGENLLAVYTPKGDELFDLDVSDADDIIRAINQAYIRGVFFNESLKESVIPLKDCPTNIIIGTIDFTQYVKNKINNIDLRVFYDTNKDWYLVAPAYNSIHDDIIEDAIKAGYYDAKNYDAEFTGYDLTKLSDFASYIHKQGKPFVICTDIENPEDIYPHQYKLNVEGTIVYVLSYYDLRELDFINNNLIEVLKEDLNEEKEGYQKKFDERTKAHIDRVNKYAKKIDRSYSNHDSDKFNELYDGYSLMSKENVTEEEQKLIDDATYKHVINNEHHPEHWCSYADVEGFSRKNPNPHGCLDCSKMPKEALEEMCCDWCAMSEEFNNTPFEWFDKVKDTRWHFNEEQEKFILDTLHKLWDDKDLKESQDTFDSIVKEELDTLNKWLDNYGFEVKLVNDYNFITKDVGMFLGDIQDNASVFPIALNKNQILKLTKKYDIILDDAIEGTLWHEAGHGIYRFLQDVYELDDNEEDVVEEFARYKESSYLFEILKDYMSENESLKESTGFPITVYTYQKPQVRELLEKGQTYIADYKRANFSNYKELAQILGLSNCPIFGALEKEDLYEMLSDCGIYDYSDEDILHLEIPKEYLRYTEFWDWDRYISAMRDPKEWKRGKGLKGYVSPEELEKRLKTQKGADSYKLCQVVFDRIEPEWYEDGLDEEDV